MGYRAGLGWPPPHKPVLSLKYRVFGQHDSNCKQFCYYIRLRSETPPSLSSGIVGGEIFFLEFLQESDAGYNSRVKGLDYSAPQLLTMESYNDNANEQRRPKQPISR